MNDKRVRVLRRSVIWSFEFYFWGAKLGAPRWGRMTKRPKTQNLKFEEAFPANIILSDALMCRLCDGLAPDEASGNA